MFGCWSQWWDWYYIKLCGFCNIGLTNGWIGGSTKPGCHLCKLDKLLPMQETTSEQRGGGRSPVWDQTTLLTHHITWTPHCLVPFFFKLYVSTWSCCSCSPASFVQSLSVCVCERDPHWLKILQFIISFCPHSFRTTHLFFIYFFPFEDVILLQQPLFWILHYFYHFWRGLNVTSGLQLKII